MNLANLQREAHALAKANGEWDHARTFGDLIALVHSELSEALEAYREWGLSSSREILRRSLRRPSYRDESETGVECWFIRNEDTGELNYWEFEEYATSCKPEGVSAELADVVIRVADMAEYYGIDLGAELETTGPPDTSLTADNTFGEWIAFGHWHLTKLYDAEMELGFLLRGVLEMSAHYGIDLDAAIWAKMDYNRTRPHRHGGKAL